MTHYDTRKEAEEACRGDETIIRVCGGWLVMTWQELRVWSCRNKQLLYRLQIHVMSDFISHTTNPSVK